MAEAFSDPRPLSGHAPAFAGPDGKPSGASQELTSGSIALGLLARAVRRHLVLIAGVTALTTILALLVFRQPAIYRATALIRLAGERRLLSAAMQEAVPELDRSSPPLQSLVPRLRSRTLIGQVVDSLGLRLRPMAGSSSWQASSAPDLGLKDVRIGSNGLADTLALSFEDSLFSVHRATDSVRARYGAAVRLGPTQFTVPKPPGVDQAVVLVVPRELAIDQLLGQLAVVPLTGTDALEVRYVDSHPSRAQRVANQIVETFNRGNITASQQQARRRGEFLAEQLKQTDEALTRAQDNLSAFRSRHVLGNAADRLAMQQSAIMTIDAQRGDLQTDLRVFESLSSQLEGSSDSVRAEGLLDLAYSPEVAADPAVAGLLRQMLEQRTRLDSLTTGPYQSSATNPEVVQLRQLLDRSQTQLARAVRSRVSALKARIGALGELRRASRSDMQALPAFQAEEERLGQQVAALSDFGNKLRLEYQRSRLSEELAAGDIEIVDLASQPYLPAGIPWWIKTAVAMVLGLGFSMALATFLEVRNHSIRGPEDLEQVLQVPGLGIIPPVAEAQVGQGLIGGPRQGNGQRAWAAPGIVPDSDQPSIGAEAFRLLYASLTYGWGDRTRTILVTSVAPQEGKTLIAGNLAATFAREGAQVLLVDCDVRRPRLHKMFQVPRAPGLLELLRLHPGSETDAAPVEDHGPAVHSYSFLPGVERPPEPAAPAGVQGPTVAKPNPAPARPRGTHVRGTAVKGLWLLPAGTWAQDPAEALRAEAVRTVLHDLAEEFDVIIVDTPPALVSADAAILAPLADDVLMVVRAGSTDRDAVERARQHLTAAGARVVGAVLNDPEGEVAGSGKLYYGYGYPVNRD